MIEDGAAIPKKSGRRTETPAQRLVRLEQGVQLAKQAKKEHDKRVLATIGGALVAEGKERAEFMEAMREILRRRVTNSSAMADIVALLAE